MPISSILFFWRYRYLNLGILENVSGFRFTSSLLFANKRSRIGVFSNTLESISLSLFFETSNRFSLLRFWNANGGMVTISLFEISSLSRFLSILKSLPCILVIEFICSSRKRRFSSPVNTFLDNTFKRFVWMYSP